MLKRVCVLGGSGFVGTHLVNRLNDMGLQVVVPTRSRASSRTLWMVPRADVVECDIHDPATLDRLFDGADAVFNLVGILNEKGDDGEGFRHVHLELTRKVLDACRARQVPRLMHMSALNAHPDAPSHYLKTKGIAENRVLNADGPGFRVAVFRPSVVFGPGDGMFAKFHQLLGLAPGVMALPCASARFAPVFVGDVVEAMIVALTDPTLKAGRYELCGPDEMTLEEIVDYLVRLTGRRRLVIPLGDGLSRRMAALLEFVPGKPMSRDNYRSATLDSVCGRDGGDGARSARTLADLGITPHRVEDIVPGYILPARRHRAFSDLRVSARRGTERA